MIKGTGGLVALFPGIAYLTGIVQLPAAMVNTASLCAFSLSIVVIIAVFQSSAAIDRLRSGRANLIAILAVVLGVIAAISYSEFAESHTVNVEQDRRTVKYVIPHAPTQRFLDEYFETDNPTKLNYESILTTGNYQLFVDPLHAESRPTRYIMYFLLLAAQLLLIVPVVAAASKLARKWRRKPARRA